MQIITSNLNAIYRIIDAIDQRIGERRSGVQNSGAELQTSEREWSSAPYVLLERKLELYSSFRGAEGGVFKLQKLL